MTPARAPMGAFVAHLFAAVLLLAVSAVAGAQAPPKDAGTGPAPSDSATTTRALELTPAERLAIYQSVTQTHKNNAAPIGFRATVGARVPDSVELKPLSDTLAKLVPQARDFSIGMVEKEVILVDPGTRQVVAVVTQEPASAVH
jgi:Protein of unknown function (DUF1236)